MKILTLCENHLFSKVFASGKRAACRSVSVCVLADRRASVMTKRDPLKRRHNRVGISIPTKLGCAVVRNRAKRIIREAYRAVDRETPVVKGKLVVICARPSIIGKKTQDVRNDIRTCLESLGLVTL